MALVALAVWVGCVERGEEIWTVTVVEIWMERKVG